MPKVGQGFTTELINPDGLSPAPVAPDRRTERRRYLQALEGGGPDPWPWSTVAEYLDALDAARPVTTLIASAGHNALRDLVIGSGRQEASPADLAVMGEELRRAFEAGARVLSFGLIYLPGLFADSHELNELASIAALYSAPLVPHIRNEAEGILVALKEMIQVAARSGAALHLSHLKVIGNEHLVDPVLETIDKASAEIDITFDQYPYGAGSTLLLALLPSWAQEGGASAILARLADRDSRVRMADDVRTGLPGWENIYGACGGDKILIANAAGEAGKYAGQSLARIAEERHVDSFVAAMDLLLEASLNVAMVDHYASEETTRRIFKHSRALVGSDGIFGSHPHPRLYGTAPRVLGRYALREGLVPPHEAVARLTATAADRLRLSDRGRIEPGLRADLVLLDPEQFVDTATYDHPKSLPPGVELVAVAGQVVWRGSASTGERPGGVLRTALVEV